MGRIARQRWQRAAGAVLLLLLPGCGWEGLRSSSEAAPTVTLRVMMTDDWTDTPPFIAAIRSFERARPGVRLEIDKLPVADVIDTLQAQVAQGAPPDVVQGHAFAAAAQGLAQPVDDLWRSSRLQPGGFLASAVDDVRWQGRLYGVPLDTTAVVLFYNTAHFTEAGLAPPTTWTSLDDLERAAAALTRPDGSRRGLALSASNWRSFAWMAANGGRLVDLSAHGGPRFSLDDSHNVEALRFMRRLVERGYAYYPTPGVLVDDALALLRAGAASMYTSGAFDLVTLAKNGTINSDIAVALMPPGPDATTSSSALGGSSLFIPEHAAQRKLAFDFMLHLTSEQFLTRFAREEGRLPARLRLLDEVTQGRPDLEVVARQVKSARAYGLDAFPTAQAAFQQALQGVLSGRSGAAAALRDAQQRSVQAVP